MQNPQDILMETPKNNVFVALKNEGETPLECLTRLKEEGFLPNDKFTYAGRLDPMASGLMLFLRGEAILNKEQYLGFDKEYEVEVLFGISTDTGDVLGKINSIINKDVAFDLKNVKNICDSLIGDTDVPYPWFSSKTINGKALHEIFRSGDDDDGAADLTRPLTKLSIQNIEILDFYMMSAGELLNSVHDRISKVKGDFRQSEILKKWDIVLLDGILLDEHYGADANFSPHAHGADVNFPILKIKVKCKSGSYMRTLAELLAEKLKTHGLAYSIKRTRVGEYSV